LAVEFGPGPAFGQIDATIISGRDFAPMSAIVWVMVFNNAKEVI